MSKTLSFLLLALTQLALSILAALLLNNFPAFAEQSHHGAEIFNHNCAACHLGGGNIVIKEKNLHKQSLIKHHINSINAIAH